MLIGNSTPDSASKDYHPSCPFAIGNEEVFGLEHVGNIWKVVPIPWK